MKIRTITAVHLIVLVCLLWFAAASAAAATKLAFIPFKIETGKADAQLQKNIVDLLTFRMTDAGQVDVIDPDMTADAVKSIQGLSGDSLAVMVAAKLHADYVLFGHIAGHGKAIQIESRMLNVTGNQAALDFKKQVADMGGVIPAINELANHIIAKGFLSAAPGGVPKTVSESKAEEPAPQVTGQTVSQTPETPAVTMQAAPQASEAPADNTLNPAFVATQGRTEQGDFWKGPTLDDLINGLAVGDVNKDGRQETVVVTPDKVIILQSAQQQMRKLTEIDSPRYTINVGVDVADINGNGKPEIFVSALNNRRNALASFVIEFDGSRFKTIARDVRWYLRVLSDGKQGPRLIGQSQKIGQTPFSQPIVELHWKNGAYQAGADVLPDGKANALGLALGDIVNDNSTKALAFTRYDHLRVMTTKGEPVWTSSAYYGGSPLYYALPPASPGDSPGRFYLPVRILLSTMGRDGKVDIIVAQNIDTAFRKLAAQRFYSKCRLIALKWDGLGLSPVWQTRELSGRIQDLTIADFDNDGSDELVAAVITAEKSLISTKSKSTLIAFKLNQ